MPPTPKSERWAPRLGSQGTWRDYVAIARPDHWFKNIFMVPGAALAYVIGARVDASVLLDLALAVVATCLLASANYSINEFLDAADDRHHPLKSARPSAAGRIKGRLVVVQWLALTAAGLAIAIDDDAVA